MRKGEDILTSSLFIDITTQNKQSDKITTMHLTKRTNCISYILETKVFQLAVVYLPLVFFDLIVLGGGVSFITLFLLRVSAIFSNGLFLL